MEVKTSPASPEAVQAAASRLVISDPIDPRTVYKIDALLQQCKAGMATDPEAWLDAMDAVYELYLKAKEAMGITQTMEQVAEPSKVDGVEEYRAHLKDQISRLQKTQYAS